MASITLKDIPADLHAQLKQEADANYRSLNQEAMFRIARTFEIDSAMTSKRDQRLIDEALASGPETTLTKRDLDAGIVRCKTQLRFFKSIRWPDAKEPISNLPASAHGRFQNFRAG
jgi:plasmid stability protein